MEQGADRPLLDWQWRDTFLFPELRYFLSWRRAQQCFFFFLYRRIFLYIFASLKCTLHLIAIEITTASYFHFLKILTQYFRRDPFAKNVWVHWLFCHRAISRFFACWPRAEISLYGCGRCGNNDASIKGDRSAAYLWAAAKHNKQDGGRRGELMSSAFISFYPADYTGRWK